MVCSLKTKHVPNFNQILRNKYTEEWLLTFVELELTNSSVPSTGFIVIFFVGIREVHQGFFCTVLYQVHNAHKFSFDFYSLRKYFRRLKTFLCCKWVWDLYASHF